MVYEDQTKKSVAAVYCPICKRRIMDIEKGTKGNIQVKCPRCRHISRIAVAFRLNKHNSHYQFAS